MDPNEKARLGLHVEAVQAVRRVLWESWDPVGVNDCPEASTEYDSYAGGIVSRLVHGATDSEVAAHLEEIERMSMGLPGGALDRRMEVAIQLREVLVELGVTSPRRDGGGDGAARTGSGGHPRPVEPDMTIHGKRPGTAPAAETSALVARPGVANIRRIRGRAKPTSRHPTASEWETALTYVLLRDDDPQLAVHRANAALREQGWETLELIQADTLIEERVREQGGEVWTDYLRAADGDVVVRLFQEHFGAPAPPAPRFLPVQITEQFFDEVVARAGGRRVDELLSDDDLNADYLLNATVFELKTLEENGLLKEARQDRLAELFAPYYPDEVNAVVDPGVLSDQDRRRFLDILGGPVQRHVKKASKQVKATKRRLGGSATRGGLIMLNLGFPSFDHELFGEQVLRYSKKDSSQFDDVIAVSVWVETNGFDTVVNHRFEPGNEGSPEVEALRTAFDQRFEEMMTDLVRGQRDPEAKTMSPSLPIAFSRAGLIFRWEPARSPLSFEQRDH